MMKNQFIEASAGTSSHKIIIKQGNKFLLPKLYSDQEEIHVYYNCFWYNLLVLFLTWLFSSYLFSILSQNDFFFHESLVFIYNYLFKQNSLCWITKQWREGVLCWT